MQDRKFSPVFSSTNFLKFYIQFYFTLNKVMQHLIFAGFFRNMDVVAFVEKTCGATFYIEGATF